MGTALSVWAGACGGVGLVGSSFPLGDYFLTRWELRLLLADYLFVMSRPASPAFYLFQ